MLFQASTLVRQTAPAFVVKHRDVAFDLIRCIAVISVIAVHVASPVSSRLNPADFNWWVANSYQAVFRSGIPLFLMLSGALLLPRATGINFVRSRVWRIFLPFSFWTGVYLIARNDIAQISLEDYLQNLISSSVYHFWYVYTILSLYLLMPLLRHFVQMVNISATGVTLSTLLTTLCSMFIPPDQLKLTVLLKIIIFAQYMVLGYRLANTQAAWWLQSFSRPVLLLITSIAITFFGTYYISNYEGVNVDLFYKSTSLNIFLKALGVWFLVKKTAFTITARLGKWASLVSKYSFGIYLMHVLVFEHVLISWLNISHHTITPASGILLSTVLTFMLSVAILYLLDKILPLKVAY